MTKTLTKHLQANKDSKHGIVPYHGGTTPKAQTGLWTIALLENSGVPVIEVFRFVDPVADGPVIELAGQRKLG